MVCQAWSAGILAIHRPSIKGLHLITSLDRALCRTRVEVIYLVDALLFEWQGQQTLMMQQSEIIQNVWNSSAEFYLKLQTHKLEFIAVLTHCFKNVQACFIMQCNIFFKKLTLFDFILTSFLSFKKTKTPFSTLIYLMKKIWFQNTYKYPQHVSNTRSGRGMRCDEAPTL